MGWLGSQTGGAPSVGNLNISKTGVVLGNILRIGAGPNGVGNVNMTGGTLIVNQAKVGWDHGTGHVTQNGGAAEVAGTLVVGCTAGNTGDYALNGGTLSAGSIVSDGGTGTLKLNGGTLQARASNTTFVAGSGVGTLNVLVQKGGAIIDTKMYNVTAGIALVEDAASKGGGLTKKGTGTLTLGPTVLNRTTYAYGDNTYSGDTRIEAGTLSVSKASLNDSANVHMTTGATFDLGFSGTDTISGLFFDNIPQAPGTWGAVGSGAQHQSAFFTGAGLLLVTVPEPGTTAALMGIGGLLAYSWRKRKCVPRLLRIVD